VPLLADCTRYGTCRERRRAGLGVVTRRQPKIALAVATLATALVVTGCSSTGAAQSAGSDTTSSTGHGSTTGTTTQPAAALQHVGLCSFSGEIPYPRIAPDGAPEVPTQFGIALAPSDKSPMLAAAYRQFNAMRCTHYQHHDVQDQVAATYYYDCVGFTSYTLRMASPQAWRSLVAATDLMAGRVPSPKLYASFFAQLPSRPQSGWNPVSSAAAILPGDLLAWSPSTEDTESAGHSVMAVSAPMSLGNGRFALVVMDSTATPHGSADTRRDDNPLSARNAPLGVLPASSNTHRAHPNAHSGLGIGTIALDAGPTGAVTGVEWTIGTPVEHVNFDAARPLPGS
jgi:hypothetical protein